MLYHFITSSFTEFQWLNSKYKYIKHIKGAGVKHTCVIISNFLFPLLIKPLILTSVQFPTKAVTLTLKG